MKTSRTKEDGGWRIEDGKNIFAPAIFYLLSAILVFSTPTAPAQPVPEITSPKLFVIEPSIDYGEYGHIDRWRVGTNEPYRERAVVVTTKRSVIQRTVYDSPKNGGTHLVTVPVVSYITNLQRLLFATNHVGEAGFGYGGLYGWTDQIAPNPITNLLLTVSPAFATNIIESSPWPSRGFTWFTNFSGTGVVFRVQAEQQFYRSVRQSNQPPQELKLTIP